MCVDKGGEEGVRRVALNITTTEFYAPHRGNNACLRNTKNLDENVFAR